MQEMQETQVRSLDREDPLEEEMATHSSILAWKVPRTEEPDTGSHKESDTTEQLSTGMCTHVHTHNIWLVFKTLILISPN